MFTVAVLWFLFSIAVAILASNKGRSAFGWFVLAMVTSPLLAGIFCAVVSNLKLPEGVSAPTPLTHVKCPDCAELVLAEAKVCKHCGIKLVPINNHAQIIQAEAKAQARTELKDLAIGIGAIVAVVLIAKVATLLG